MLEFMDQCEYLLPFVKRKVAGDGYYVSIDIKKSSFPMKEGVEAGGLG